jgi:UDP-N-acetyl-D-glucosamine dehydrogenase
VRIADPYVTSHPALDAIASRVELTPEELETADAVVVLTDHDAFDYDLVAAHAPYVLDTRNRVRGHQVEYL